MRQESSTLKIGKVIVGSKSQRGKKEQSDTLVMALLKDQNFRKLLDFNIKSFGIFKAININPIITVSEGNTGEY